MSEIEQRESFRRKEQHKQRSQGLVGTERIHCDWSLLRERGAGEKGEEEESRDCGARLVDSQQGAEFGAMVAFFFQSLARVRARVGKRTPVKFCFF